MNLLKILFGYGSRKVTFGWHLFIVANLFLVYKLISSDQWFTAIGLVSVLIGGGTLGDAYFKSKGVIKEEPPKS